MAESPFNVFHQNNGIEHKIIAGLERLSKAFSVLLWNEGKKLSLSPIQMQILIFLLYHGKEYRNVSYLAMEFGITKATVSDAVRVLAEKSLIKKEYNKHDTRNFIIHLTRRGEAVAERVSHFSSALQVPVTNLTTDEKNALLISLMNIIHHLNKTGVITTQRMCYNCAYYRPDHNGHKHFCSLLNTSLQSSEIRLDCPEHHDR